MMIGIARRARMAVVQAMVALATAVGQGRIQQKNRLADAAIGLWPIRPEAAVHGVVGHDEQPRLKQGAAQHPDDHKDGRELEEGGGEQDSPAPQPTQDKSGGEREASPGGRRQRANFSSSAAEASRSMATK
jgi:hypothetical protein